MPGCHRARMARPASTPDGACATLAWLGHPVSVLALVVLLLNDHLFKVLHPGVLTGKASDVAGLLVAPPLAAVLATLLAPRLRPDIAAAGALLLVAAGFALVKSSGWAAAAASAGWTAVGGPSLVRADRTDLVALPALGLAWWAWCRARREPVRRRSARLLRLLVVLPVAVLGVAATSAAQYPEADQAAAVDGRLLAGRAGEQTGYQVSDRWWGISDDAGATWHTPAAADKTWLSSARITGDVRRNCSVAIPTLCYRVMAARLGVERSDDGGRTWGVAWEVTEKQRYVLSRRYPMLDRRDLTSRSLAVLDTADGRHAVLVANGRDGFALRRPDGSWDRIGFAGGDAGFLADAAAAPLDDASLMGRGTDVVRVLALLLAFGGLVLVVAGGRATVAAGVGLWSPVCAGLILAAAGLPLTGAWLTIDGNGGFLMAAFGLLPLTLMALLFVLVPLAGRTSRRWLVEMLSATALGVVLPGLPLVGWLYGRPVYPWVAIPLALAAAVPGLVLAWRAGRLVRPTLRRDPPYPPFRGGYPPDPPWPLQTHLTR